MLHGISIHVQNSDKGGIDMAEGGISEFEPEAIFSFWFSVVFYLHPFIIYLLFCHLPLFPHLLHHLKKTPLTLSGSTHNSPVSPETPEDDSPVLPGAPAHSFPVP